MVCAYACKQRRIWELSLKGTSSSAFPSTGEMVSIRERAPSPSQCLCNRSFSPFSPFSPFSSSLFKQRLYISTFKSLVVHAWAVLLQIQRISYAVIQTKESAIIYRASYEFQKAWFTCFIITWEIYNSWLYVSVGTPVDAHAADFYQEAIIYQT